MFKNAYATCVFALGMTGAIYAQPNMPVLVTHTTGLVGIAEGQTAQLNALNPDSTPCTGALTILGDDGSVLRSVTYTIAPGTGMHIIVDSLLNLNLALGARRDIRGTISVIAAPSSASTSTTTITPSCRLIGTLEIFNESDGHTLVTLGTTHDVTSPTPTPVLGTPSN
jgi:hypothetical protein